MSFPDSYVACGHMTQLCPMSYKYKVTWQLLRTFLKRKLAHALWCFFLLLPGSCCWRCGCSHRNSVSAHEDMSPTIGMEEQWVQTNPDLWWLGRRSSSYCPSQPTLIILIQSYVGFLCMLYKSLQLCMTLCDPMDCSPPGFLCPWDSPGKNTGVGCHGPLQGIFLTQGSNLGLLCLLHWQAGILAATPNSYWYNVQAYSAGTGQNLQIHLTSIFLSNRMSSPYPNSAWLTSVHHGNC